MRLWLVLRELKTVKSEDNVVVIGTFIGADAEAAIKKAAEKEVESLNISINEETTYSALPWAESVELVVTPKLCFGVRTDG